jgi:hypothetical protein
VDFDDWIAFVNGAKKSYAYLAFDSAYEAYDAARKMNAELSGS